MGKQNGRKRSHEDRDDAYKQAYAQVRFVPILSTGRPGTPHRYFAESYTVERIRSDSKPKDANDAYSCTDIISQVVHKHANGLVVVTAGNHLPPNTQSLQLLIQESPAAQESAATKRKQQAKMLKGKQMEGSVHPNDVIATISFLKGGQQHCVPLLSNVWGTVLEVNPSLGEPKARLPRSIAEDPLLDGYLAVVLPSGPFPPAVTLTGELLKKETDNSGECFRQAEK